MRRKAETAILAMLALAAPGAAGAQEPPMTELEEAMGRRKVAPDIPPELRPIVREATRDRLVIRALNGADIVVDIAEIEPAGFRLFAGGRFLGFAFNGYEFFGYTLVDRTMAGEAAQLATGDAPVFAADGRHFAAVQRSGADFGGLEGLGIWRVGAEGTVPIFFTDVLPEGEDWRIDGWPRADCVSVSAVPRALSPDEPPPERRHFGVELGDQLMIRDSYDSVACNVTDGTGND